MSAGSCRSYSWCHVAPRSMVKTPASLKNKLSEACQKAMQALEQLQPSSPALEPGPRAQPSSPALQPSPRALPWSPALETSPQGLNSTLGLEFGSSGHGTQPSSSPTQGLRPGAQLWNSPHPRPGQNYWKLEITGDLRSQKLKTCVQKHRFARNRGKGECSDDRNDNSYFAHGA